MKKILVIIFLLLSSCTKLSEEERAVIGEWEWNIVDGEFSEKGYLKLNKNGKYMYSHTSTHSTETMTQSFGLELFEWYVQDNKICLNRGVDEPPDCERFIIVNIDQKPSISFKNGFIKENILATKVSPPNK